METKQFYESRRASLEQFTNFWIKVSVILTIFMLAITTSEHEYIELLYHYPIPMALVTLTLVPIFFFSILCLGIVIKDILVTRRLHRNIPNILLLLCLVIPLTTGSSHGTQNSKEELWAWYSKPLSIEDSVRWVLKDKVSPYVVELLVAQSKHESGNYTNSLAKQHKNLFGRHWHKSDTLALGPGGKAEGHSRFSRFKSIRDATLSQYNYLVRKGYSFDWKSPKEFAEELKKRHYYEDNITNYTNCLTKHLNYALPKWKRSQERG